MKFLCGMAVMALLTCSSITLAQSNHKNEPPRRFTQPPSLPATPPVPDDAETDAAAERLSIPVSTDRAVAEIAERKRLNREQAEFASNQNAENEAARFAYQLALRDREATIARLKTEHQAELHRLAREHAEAMARWEADVDACNKGDLSRCRS